MLAQPDLNLRELVPPKNVKGRTRQRLLTGWTAEQGQSWDRKEKEARKKRKEGLSVPSVAVSGPREEGGRQIERRRQHGPPQAKNAAKERS